MFKHTDGPWVVLSGSVYSGDGRPLAHMDREVGNGTLPVERDCNAHVMSAAAEMLELLKFIVGKQDKDPSDSEWLLAARDVVEKAERNNGPL